MKRADVLDIIGRVHTLEDLDFQRRVMERSGLTDDGTFLPPAINPSEWKVRSRRNLRQ